MVTDRDLTLEWCWYGCFGIADPSFWTQSGTEVFARGRQWLAMVWVVETMSLVLVIVGDRHDLMRRFVASPPRRDVCGHCVAVPVWSGIPPREVNPNDSVF